MAAMVTQVKRMRIESDETYVELFGMKDRLKNCILMMMRGKDLQKLIMTEG